MYMILSSPFTADSSTRSPSPHPPLSFLDLHLDILRIPYTSHRIVSLHRFLRITDLSSRPLMLRNLTFNYDQCSSPFDPWVEKAIKLVTDILLNASSLISLTLLGLDDVAAFSLPPKLLRTVLASLPRLERLKLGSVTEKHQDILVDVTASLRTLEWILQA